jgi:hypothetical protein
MEVGCSLERVGDWKNESIYLKYEVEDLLRL